jgi:hypothetical protein
MGRRVVVPNRGGTPTYPLGTLKLTWVNPTNFNILESKMFRVDELPTLMDEAKRTNLKKFLVFKLVETEGNSFKWELQPQGSYKEFNFGMSIYENRFYQVLILGVLGFAIYGVYKMIKK